MNIKALDKSLAEINDYIESNGLGNTAIYGAFEIDDDNIPINNLNTIPIYGKVIASYEGNNAVYNSQLLENPTWLDLFKCAEEAVRYTNDFYHIFFDGFNVEGKLGDVTYIDLLMEN